MRVRIEKIRGKRKVILGPEALWELVQAWVGYQNGDLGTEGGHWVPGEKNSGWWEMVSEREVNEEHTLFISNFVLELYLLGIFQLQINSMQLAKAK